MLPAENVATLAGSMDGTRTYEMLQKIPMYSMVFAMAPQVKPIMEAIDGRHRFVVPRDDGQRPDAGAFADRGAEGSGDHGNDQRDDSRADAGDGSRPVCVEPDANTTIYFGLNDNTFYATTDSDAWYS